MLSTRMGAYNQPQFQGTQMPPSGLHGHHAHTWYTDILADKTPIHVFKIFICVCVPEHGHMHVNLTQRAGIKLWGSRQQVLLPSAEPNSHRLGEFSCASLQMILPAGHVDCFYPLTEEGRVMEPATPRH